MVRHIVCSGCSFTRQQKRIGINGTDLDFMQDSDNFWRWPHHLQNLYKNDIVYNLGNPTNDNQVISFSIISKVSQLLDKGISPNDIFVIVQWSDSNRKSFFISDEVANIHNSKLLVNDSSDDAYSHVSAFLDESDDNIGKNGYFIQSGGYNYNHVPYDVVKMYDTVPNYISNEETTIQFFKNILLLQNFLKVKNIDFIQFNLSVNFNPTSNSFSFREVYYDKKISKSFFYRKYDNPYLEFLYKQIDMSKMWLFQNEDTDNGGILEWSIKNFELGIDKRLFMEHDFEDIYSFIESKKEDDYALGHPSSDMNMKFVEKILKKFV